MKPGSSASISVSESAEDLVCDVVGAVLGDREQQQRERTARVVVEPAEQAEVEQREPAVRRQQHVARGAGRRGRRPRASPGGCRSGRTSCASSAARSGCEAVRRASTFSPSIFSSTSTRSVTYGRMTRGTTIDVLVGSASAGDQLGVERLLLEVELAAQVHLELLGERAHLQELAPSRERRSSRPAVERSSARSSSTSLLDPGPPHLDDDLAPVVQQRLVHLRDRRGRDRLRVEPREDVEADVRVDHRPDLRERHRRRVVDELRRAPRCRRPAAGRAATRAAARA